MQEYQQTVLSGMQPTGELHLGHLLGVMNTFVQLQEKYQCFFMIADLHAMTTFYDKYSLTSTYVKNMVANWLAADIDPKKSTIFVQSMVPEHAELYLILNSFTPVSWLLRNPTYKEKIDNLDIDVQNLGFLSYPVLQAADILLYQAKYVPIGEDQLPHLEITREITRRVLHKIQNDSTKSPNDAKIFTIPEAILSKSPKVIGTDGRKMSKSYDNVIKLTDPVDEITQKVKKMKTDEKRIRRDDPGDPSVCPVYSFYNFFLPAEEKQVEQDCKLAKIGCVDCKKKISSAIVQHTEKFRDYQQMLTNKPNTIDDILHEGAKKARSIAQKTLYNLKKAIGFYSI